MPKHDGFSSSRSVRQRNAGCTHINQHLAEALDSDREPPATGAHLTADQLDNPGWCGDIGTLVVAMRFTRRPVPRATGRR
jgi:hypothetical protein